MLDLWCPAVGSTVLRSWSDIVGIAHPEHGAVDVVMRCHCGQLVLLRTGRARGRAEAAVHGVDPNVLARQAPPSVGVGT